MTLKLCVKENIVAEKMKGKKGKTVNREKVVHTSKMLMEIC